MFFIASKSASNEYSPSYTVLDMNLDKAVDLYNQIYKPYLTGQANAVKKIALCSCEPGQDPGEEKVLREMFTTAIMPAQGRAMQKWSAFCEKYPDKYTHPLDLTVYHDESEGLPDGLMEALTPLLKWEHFSFPNGSNYNQEKLKTGKQTLAGFGEVYIQYGYTIRINKWHVYKVPGNYTYGPGTDFGIHFNNQDRWLTAFNPYRPSQKISAV